MALPADFWRNEQMLNIFRTKPCQRLCRDRVCDWRSQCQYSHCLEWPRRSPQKHAYSPELCVHIRLSPNGEVQVDGVCPAGARCQQAHSKEEILYHPHIFKTKLCEEYRSSNGNQRNSRGNNRTRCHRYYCPFAHGQQELRSSPLSAEQRDRCLRVLENFPSDDCCRVCLPHRIDSLRLDGSPGGNVMGCVACSPANPQEVPTSQSPGPTMWALPQPLPAQAALTNGDPDHMMGLPKDRFHMPYNPQGSPPHLAALGSPQTPIVFRQWGAANDPAGFGAVSHASLTAEGCGLVLPGQQLPQELQQSPQVHALGSTAAGGPPGSTPPHTQMLVAMAPATSMQGCGLGSGVSPAGPLSMVQLTHIGQAPAGVSLAASTPGGPMQMLQVTSVNAASQQGAAHLNSSAAHGDQAAAVAQWLRSIGLERCVPGLMRNGFDDKEVIANMTAEDMVQLGMTPAEQQSLVNSIIDMRRQKNSENQAGLPRSNSMCMALMANGSATPRPPGMSTVTPGMQAMQPVLLSNGAYGQWIQTGSPQLAQAANPGAMPNGFGAWSPQAIPMTQFVTPLPQPQQANEQGGTPQPGYPTGPPQQAGQQMPAQQQEVSAAMFLPPVPPFPIQAQQAMQHQGQQPNSQQSPQLQPSQQQLPLQMSPQAQLHGLAMQALPAPQQQHQQQQQQQQQQHQLLAAPMSASAPAASAMMSSQGALGNGHATPGASPGSSDRWAFIDDSPASNSIKEDSANGKSPKRRNQKFGEQNKVLMRQVEKLLEAEDPPIMPLQDLRKRLMEFQDNPATLNKLMQNLKVLPDRFLINNEYVSLTKFAHLDPVKSKFDRQRR